MSAEPIAAARTALAGRAAWLVGGVIRDGLLGRATTDVDIVVDDDVRACARALAAAAGAASFPLSAAHGHWRVVAADHSWQADLVPLTGGSIEEDLRRRDFTVNAIAEPLAGGDRIDPLGGERDLAERRLRLAGPAAMTDDPLRALRLARFAADLGLEPEPESLDAARAVGPVLGGVAPERVFAELRALVCGRDPLRGLHLMDAVGVTAALLPELAALEGVEQNRYHHLDVHGHTREVLARVLDVEAGPADFFGPELGARAGALLAEPLADEMTRAGGLRLGALLHDVAKPRTRVEMGEGRVGFPGHDVEGAAMARDVLARLRASERLRGHVEALARHHLRPGFLVHHVPLSARDVHAYLRACGATGADVALLSVADRLATRGRKAEEAAAAHLEVARELLAAALDWREQGPPAPLVRGDELAAALGIEPGPLLGEVLAELEAAAFAGDVDSRESACAHARAFLADRR